MTTWLLYPLIGTGTGAVYAAIAMGVIITYRGSGVVNFAQGAMATFPALVFLELAGAGRPGAAVGRDPESHQPRRQRGDGAGVPPGGRRGRADRAAGRPAHLPPPAGLDPPGQGDRVGRPQHGADRPGGAPVRCRAPQGPADPARRHRRAVRPIRSPRTASGWPGWSCVAGVVLWLVYKYTTFGLATQAAAANEKGAEMLGHSARAARHHQLGHRRRAGRRRPASSSRPCAVSGPSTTAPTSSPPWRPRSRRGSSRSAGP